MRLVFNSLLIACVSTLMISCAMGPPETEQSDSNLATMEGALQQIEAPERVQHNDLEMTEAQFEIEANAPVCDDVCTVRQWVKEERYAEAREVLSGKLQSHPKDLDTVLMLTTVDIMDEEYVKAYQRAHDYLSADGSKHVALMQRRAAASLMSHDVETAVEDYRELISELQSNLDDPTARICDPLTSHCVTSARHEAHAWAGLATVQYNRGKLEQAESIARDLIEDAEMSQQIDPAHGQFILALTATKRNDDATAKAHYQKVLDRHPNSPGTLNNIGVIHYRASDFDTARRYFIRAYENAGKWRRIAAISWANVAELDMLEGKYEQAEEKALEALATSKYWAGGHFSLATLYDVMGKNAESARHMKRALALDTQGVTRWNTSFFHTDWETHFHALIAEAQGQNEKAQRLWNQLTQSRFPELRQTAEHHIKASERLAVSL